VVIGYRPAERCMSCWTPEVRLEPARLAIVDPLGELDAIQPLYWAEPAAVEASA
jgi:hypothetical protein